MARSYEWHLEQNRLQDLETHKAIQMINHPNRSKHRVLYHVRLTLHEINALLGAVGNVDAPAMAHDYETEAEGDAFLAALDSATEKLHGAK